MKQTRKASPCQGLTQTIRESHAILTPVIFRNVWLVVVMLLKQSGDGVAFGCQFIGGDLDFLSGCVGVDCALTDLRA